MFKRRERNLRQAFSRVFQRYCKAHYVVRLAGRAIIPFKKDVSGHIDRHSIGAASTSVDGWTTADKVSLAPAGQFDWTEPNIRRDDACRALNLPSTSHLGFSLTATSSNDLVFAVKSGTETMIIPLPQPTRIQRITAKLKVRLSFAKDICRALPLLASAWSKPSARTLQAAKRSLRLQPDEAHRLIDSELLAPGNTKQHTQTVSIVMPVFNALEALEASLQRVAEGTFGPWRMILVNDCSTDPKVSIFLKTFADTQNRRGVDVQILETPSNIGFVGAANIGLKAAATFGDHVVLLNSDAMVPKNWLSRLVNPILRDPQIASVTPLSNDAEILSVPRNCAQSPMSSETIDVIDTALANSISNTATIEVPTGIGFCMAMNWKYVELHPQFDPIFGRGYGEEVDWCNRARKSGGINVGLPSLYVGHIGSASFGSTAKLSASHTHNQIISNRYPKFDHCVRAFIDSDPILTARLVTAVSHASSTQSSLEIYIGHSMGGGANQYLNTQINRNLKSERSTIVLRVGGHRRWQLEVHTPFGKIIGQTNVFECLAAILSETRNTKLIYSCAVGDCDPVSIPDLLLHLRRTLDCPLQVLFHDYFPLNPSYCLLDKNNNYLGAKGFSPDTYVARSNGKDIKLHQWQASWRKLVTAADEITFFSKSSEKIVRDVFGLTAKNVKIQPHKLQDLVFEHSDIQPRKDGSLPNLGVLGDIGPQKGSKLVSQISNIISDSELFEKVVVVGRFDPSVSKPNTLDETGPYDRRNIKNLAAINKIECWLIPSIWPETFCFTIHEALQTGLPVFCFDLGAQAEVAAKIVNGHILPLDASNDPYRTLKLIERTLSNVKAMPGSVHTTQKNGRRSIAAR